MRAPRPDPPRLYEPATGDRLSDPEATETQQQARGCAWTESYHGAEAHFGYHRLRALHPLRREARRSGSAPVASAAWRCRRYRRVGAPGGPVRLCLGREVRPSLKVWLDGHRHPVLPEQDDLRRCAGPARGDGPDARLSRPHRHPPEGRDLAPCRHRRGPRPGPLQRGPHPRPLRRGPHPGPLRRGPVRRTKYGVGRSGRKELDGAGVVADLLSFHVKQLRHNSAGAWSSGAGTIAVVSFERSDCGSAWAVDLERGGALGRAGRSAAD